MLGREGVESVLTPARHDDGASLGQQLGGQRLADAGCGTDDEGFLVQGGHCGSCVFEVVCF